MHEIFLPERTGAPRRRNVPVCQTPPPTRLFELLIRMISLDVSQVFGFW
jgi:hypothetical protein